MAQEKHGPHRFSVSTTVESPLKPLLLFAEYYQETVIQKIVKYVTALFLYILSRVTGRVPSQSALSLSFCTPFGLQVDIRNSTDDDNDNSNSHGTISLSTQIKRIPSGQETPYGYRIATDFSTTGFWHRDTPPDESYMVEHETIKDRFKEIVPFYEMWIYEFDTLQMEHGIHLGILRETMMFSDLRKSVAWEVAGFLIACWLVMQDNVTDVVFVFEQVEKKKLVTKENMGEALVELLKIEMAILQGTVGDTFTSRL